MLEVALIHNVRCLPVCGFIVLLQDPAGDAKVAKQAAPLGQQRLLENLLVLTACDVSGHAALLIEVGCLVTSGASHNVQLGHAQACESSVDVDN